MSPIWQAGNETRGGVEYVRDEGAEREAAMRAAGETSAHAHHHARRHTARLLGAGLAGGVAVLAARLLFAGGGEDSWVLAARHTARFSALWFMVAFAAGPLARITRASWARVLVRERRGIGLGFCAAHTVHLAAILLWLGHGGEADAATLAGGGLAYLLLFAMAATSNDAAVRRLGPRRWLALHTAGQYILWLAFAQTYLGRVLAADARPVHLALAAALAAVMGLRLFTVLTRFDRRAPTTP
jgi:DMSO/TMAO reductase YedYZ heme-binding membrane subunit